MTKVELAKASQKNQLKEMWKYCFYDSDTYIHWLFDRVHKPENTLVVCEGDTVAAALQMFPHTISLCGKTLPAMYVGGVTTRPECRGKGYVNALMEKVVQTMYERGVAVSLLIPFKFEFYRKYGYEATHFLSDYEGEIDTLKKYAVPCGQIAPYTSAPVDVYNAFARDKGSRIVRDEALFEQTNEEMSVCGGKFYTLADGGYIIYEIVNRVFTVYEMAYTGRSQLAQLLGFIYSHSSQAEKFKIRAAADGFLRNVLCEKTVTETRYPHLMTRIINAKTVLETLSSRLAPGEEVALDIKDSILPQNNRAFRIAPFSVQEAEGGISVDTKALSQLVHGTISAREAEFMGLINTSDKLDSLFIKKENYINMLGWV